MLPLTHTYTHTRIRILFLSLSVPLALSFLLLFNALASRFVCHCQSLRQLLNAFRKANETRKQKRQLRSGRAVAAQ